MVYDDFSKRFAKNIILNKIAPGFTISTLVRRCKHGYFDKKTAFSLSSYEMQEILDKIIAYTDKAHNEQMRKYTPERYIVHPVRVMKSCREYTDDLTVLASAILHDVLEDTPVTPNELLEFLQTVMTQAEAERTLALVIELTDVYVKEKYPKMNRRQRKAKEQERMAATSADAQTIKYADIMDNCAEIVGHDAEFAPLFLNECRQLLTRMNKGNQDLFQRALAVVEKGLELIRQNGRQ